MQQRETNIDFDKKDWVLKLKALKKEYIVEDRERYRPLLNIKKEIKEYFEEVEKEEQKGEVAIRKEFNALYAAIQKQSQEVGQARTMITKAASDPSMVERVHAKVKGIEQNLKTFKLKSRTVYEQLADEEQQLMSEMEMWSSKFEAYADEKSSVKDIVASSKSTAASGVRSNSVGNRLHRQQKSLTSSSKATLQTDEDTDDGVGQSEANQIKRSLEQVENHLIRNGGINCGWDAADHKDFLRIRTKHHNNVCTLAFIQELLRCVPNIDDEGVKSHVRAYDTYLELCEFKKTLLLQYKEAKKKAQADRVTKLDTHNKMYSKLNTDLDLVTDGGSNPDKHPNDQAEREALKKQLEVWKHEKENIKVREREEKKRKEEQAKSMLSRKLLEENRAKKEQVEEFKYRKELEKMREQQIQEMEKRKQKELALNQEAKERIWKREEEVFMKKHQKIQAKQIELEEKEHRMESAMAKASKGLKDKVESRLTHETQAMKDKKRDKYDQAKDGKRDAMTMGGNLLGVSVRAMPFWRQGV